MLQCITVYYYNVILYNDVYWCIILQGITLYYFVFDFLYTMIIWRIGPNIMYLCVYIYIYREREILLRFLTSYYIYIYVYIYTHTVCVCMYIYIYIHNVLQVNYAGTIQEPYTET